MDKSGESSLGKIALGVAGIVIAIYFLWDPINRLMDGLVRLAVWGIMIGLVCVLIYQGFDALRSGLTGTQSKVSKEVDDPTAPSERLSGIFLGLIFLAIALATVFFALKG